MKITVTIRFTDGGQKAVSGIRVDLHSSAGFRGEQYTDNSGTVMFEDVPPWTTYDLWVEHRHAGTIQTSGRDEHFQRRFSN